MYRKTYWLAAAFSANAIHASSSVLRYCTPHRLYTLLHFAFSNSNYTLHFIIQSKRSFGLMDKWLGCLNLLLVCSLFRFQITAAGLTGHLQNDEDCGRLGACGRLQTMFEKLKKRKRQHLYRYIKLS